MCGQLYSVVLTVETLFADNDVDSSLLLFFAIRRRTRLKSSSDKSKVSVYSSVSSLSVSIDVFPCFPDATRPDGWPRATKVVEGFFVYFHKKEAVASRNCRKTNRKIQGYRRSIKESLCHLPLYGPKRVSMKRVRYLGGSMLDAQNLPMLEKMRESLQNMRAVVILPNHKYAERYCESNLGG